MLLPHAAPRSGLKTDGGCGMADLSACESRFVNQVDTRFASSDGGLAMKRSSAVPKRAGRAERGSSTRSSDLSALRKRELVALVSELQARVEQGQVIGVVSPESPSMPDTAPAQPGRPAHIPCLVIDESVRSGQVIEFPQGDVTVVGSVGSGAEIVAGGSIHIYGTLRGRALAGTAGDPTARIFCRRFQPEILAINGSYRLADNFFSAELWDRAVQARLEGMTMSLTPLD
jgi:septum site-determining protein MinC